MILIDNEKTATGSEQSYDKNMQNGRMNLVEPMKPIFALFFWIESFAKKILESALFNQN